MNDDTPPEPADVVEDASPDESAPDESAPDEAAPVEPVTEPVTVPDPEPAAAPVEGEPVTEQPSAFEVTVSFDPATDTDTADVHIRYDTGRVIRAEHGEAVPDQRHVTEPVNVGGVKLHPPELLADHHAAVASDDLTRAPR